MKKQIITLGIVAVAAGALIIAGCKKADTTPPVITLIGGNMSLYIGQAYTDPGATAEDNEDGNLTSSIVVTNNVNTAQAGTYTVHYSVTDAAGNEGTADRTVTVTNQAANLAGTYSVKDSVWGGGVTNYTDNISVSSTVNNRVLVTKFGNYVNGAVYMDVTNNMTSINVPSQQVNCGNPSALRNFNTPSPGTISSTTPTTIVFDYQEITGSTSVMARATYIKQ